MGTFSTHQDVLIPGGRVSDKNEWSITVLKVDEEQRFYRVRQAPPAGLVTAEYPNCVIIEWKWEPELPSEALTETHKQFERHLDPLAENNPNSLLMHVYTKPGLKEWCYYARDYPKFMAELNVALTGKPRFPIEILQDTDPEWKYWANIKEFSESEPTT